MNHKGYFVKDKYEEFGIPVVATSAREAKRIGYAASEMACDWIDVRCSWQRHANVDGLPIGIVHDFMDALRRDLLHWVEEATCDICDMQDTYVESLDGMAVCIDCAERIYYILDHQ